MTSEQGTLWKRIKNFEIGDPRSQFSFSDRLARENGWSLEYALRVIHEYKKFIFLICIADHPCSPSEEVDQAWHLHLLYTVSYWEDFCDKTLGRKIHHGPTKGGTEEKAKHFDLYEKTLNSYSDTFEMNPPSDIWPDTESRYRYFRYQRVNLHTHRIIRRIVKK